MSIETASKLRPNCLDILDILTTIFGYIPSRGLILSVSLVCKRWRYAALITIKSLVTSTINLDKVVKLFPRLTNLTVIAQAMNISNISITGLRSLSLKFCSYGNLENVFISGLTSLQSTSSSEQIVCPLLKFNQQTLSAISAKEFQLRRIRLTEFQFPLLNDLELYYSHDIGIDFYQWFRKHCSQLTRLSLLPDRIPHPLPTGSFNLPLLKSLNLGFMAIALFPFFQLPAKCEINYFGHRPIINDAVPTRCIKEVICSIGNIQANFINLCVSLKILEIDIVDLRRIGPLITPVNLLTLRLSNSQNIDVENINIPAFPSVKILSLALFTELPINFANQFPKLVQLLWRWKQNDDNNCLLAFFTFMKEIPKFSTKLRYLDLNFPGHLLSSPVNSSTQPEENTSNSTIDNDLCGSLVNAWPAFIWILENRGLETLYLNCSEEFIKWLRTKTTWVQIEKI